MIYILVYVGIVISMFALVSAWYFTMLLLDPYFTELAEKVHNTRLKKNKDKYGE